MYHGAGVVSQASLFFYEGAGARPLVEKEAVLRD